MRATSAELKQESAAEAEAAANGALAPGVAPVPRRLLVGVLGPRVAHPGIGFRKAARFLEEMTLAQCVQQVAFAEEPRRRQF